MDREQLSNIGCALSGGDIELKVLDFESGEEMMEGEEGEICIFSDQVGVGYLRRDELTAERFKALASKRMYRTGDVAKVGRDGELELVGRRDRQVKVNGFRVELDEVEHVVRAVECVQEAAIIFKESNIICYIEVAKEDSNQLTFNNLVGSDVKFHVVGNGMEYLLKESLRTHLPEHMIPFLFICLPSLPRNNSDKLDRTMLPDWIEIMKQREGAPRER